MAKVISAFRDNGKTSNNNNNNYNNNYYYYKIKYYNKKIKKNEMGGACGAYGAGERGVQGSGGET